MGWLDGWNMSFLLGFPIFQGLCETSGGYSFSFFEVEVKHAVSWDERSHRVHEHPTIQNRTDPCGVSQETSPVHVLGDLK